MSKAVNILQLTTSTDMGGAENIVLNIIKNKSSKFNYILVSLKGDGYLHKKASQYEITSYFLNLCNPFNFFKLNRIIKKHHIDIIQTHGITAQTLVSLVPNAKNTILISTMHGINDFSNSIKSLLFRMSNKKVNYWISVTYAGAFLLQNQYHISAEKIHTIHNGIQPFNGYHNASPQSSSQLRVLTVANLKKIKGHETLLQAAKILWDQGKRDIRFIFVGRDDFGGKLQHKATEFGISEMIEFAGFQSDIQKWYLDADIFCLPSISEGLPVAILEAMHAGLPVISTPVGGIPEAIQHEKTGILVPPGDPEKLCESILRLANNPQLQQQLIQSAKKTASEAFSLTGMIDNYENFYTRILQVY